MAKPDTHQLHRLAQRAANQGDFEAVRRYCLEILTQDPGFADAWFLQAVSAETRQETSKALSHIEKAVHLEPENAEYLAQAARVLVRLKRFQQARDYADRALNLAPADTPTLDNLGVCFSHLGDHVQAIACFEAANETGEFNADRQFNLASSLKFNGDLENAENAYDDVTRQRPDYFKAYSARSQVRLQTNDDNHIEELESLLKQYPTDTDAQRHLGHALAKEYEDLGKFDDAFRSLEGAKKSRRTEIAYKPDSDQQLFASVRQAFGVDRLRPTNNTDSRPIFIFGMPRTGTTLVERILSAHPSVTSAGELLALPMAVKRIANSDTNRTLDRETIEAVDTAQLDDLAASYLAEASQFAPDAIRFVDKLPINFFYAGLIRAMLPQARMVCLRRDPLDSCLGNYRQLFAKNFPYYDYSYDLNQTGLYYLEFDRLINHWAEQIPDHLLQIQYEELATDLEPAVRRMLEFLELDWHPACLDFAENPAPVATASAVQVRQPISTSSIGRWRHYEEHLAELKALLAKEGLVEQD